MKEEKIANAMGGDDDFFEVIPGYLAECAASKAKEK